MEAKILFRTSRRIHPRFETLRFGKYVVEPIPGSPVEPGQVPATDRYLLRFEEPLDREATSANPQSEARLALAYLAMSLGTCVAIDSEMLGSVQCYEMAPEDRWPELHTVIETLPDLSDLLVRLQSLDSELAQQYIRAMEVYQAGLKLAVETPTVSWFLMTVAIECLSDKVVPSQPVPGDGAIADAGAERMSKSAKFIEFVCRYAQDLGGLASEEDLRHCLQEIYREHRSAFTHGGRPTPQASVLADMLGRKYVTNLRDGRAVKTPGLRWFSGLVRKCLTQFLSEMPIKDEPARQDYFREWWHERTRVDLIARKGVQPGPVVISDEVFELD